MRTAALFGLAALGLVVSGCSFDGGYAEGQRKMAKEAMQAVASKMKDPSSVQWGAVWVGKGGVTCGYVNGKNSFGAYAGFQRFAGPWLENEDEVHQFSTYWRDCTRGADTVIKKGSPGPTFAGGTEQLVVLPDPPTPEKADTAMTFDR